MTAGEFANHNDSHLFRIYNFPHPPKPAHETLATHEGGFCMTEAQAAETDSPTLSPTGPCPLPVATLKTGLQPSSYLRKALLNL